MQEFSDESEFILLSFFVPQTIYLCIDFLCAAFCFWSKLCCCAICLCVAGMLQVSGMQVYTSGDVEAVNGTDVRLKCTFQSSASINPDSIVISWSFRPLKPGREQSVSVCMFEFVWKSQIELSSLCQRTSTPSANWKRNLWVIRVSTASKPACVCYVCMNIEKR